MTITVGSLTSSDPELAAIAVTTAVVNTFPVYTAVGPPVVVTNKPISPFAFTLVDDADAATMRATLLAAPLASPSFTGLPKAPNPTTLAVGESIATTPWVTTQITNATTGLFVPLIGGVMSGTLTISNTDVDFVLYSTVNAAQMYIAAPVNKQSYIYFQTGRDTASLRWVIGKEGTIEGTGNAGANFLIYCYDNAGQPIGTVVSIPRSSRVANFTFAPTTSEVLGTGETSQKLATTQFTQNVVDAFASLAVFTGTATFQAATFNSTVTLDDGSNLYVRHSSNTSYIFIDSPESTSTAGYASYLVFQAAAESRWLIGKNTAVEDTAVAGRTGANFVIYSYANDGTDARNEMAIYRDTGAVYFAGIVKAAAPIATSDTTDLATTSWVRNNSQIVTLRSLGVPTDGLTDCSTAIENALAGLVRGQTLDGEGITYKCLSQVSYAGTANDITLQNIIFNFASAPESTQPYLYIHGSITPTPTNDPVTAGGIGIAGSQSAGDISIPLDVTWATARGDWVFIIDPLTIWSSKHSTWPSEMHEVKSTGSTSISLYGGLYYDISGSSVVFKIVPLKGWTFRNVKVNGLSDGTTDRANFGVRLEYMLDVLVDHCSFERWDYSCLQFRRCIRGRVTNCNFAHGVGTLSFGCHMVDGCHDMVVTGNSFSDFDQACDLGNNGSYTGGVNRQVVISGNNFRDCRSEAVSTHASADMVIISDNTIHCSRLAKYAPYDSTASRSSGAVYLRGTNTSFKNNKCWNAGDAVIECSTEVDSQVVDYEISGNEFRQCYGAGMMLYTDANTRGIRHLDVHNNLIECIYSSNDGSSAAIRPGILVEPSGSTIERTKITGNTVTGYAQGIRVNHGATFNSEKVDVSDNYVYSNIAAMTATLGIEVRFNQAQCDRVRVSNNLVTQYVTPIQIWQVTGGSVLKYVTVCNNGVEPYAGSTGRGINIAGVNDNDISRCIVHGNQLMVSMGTGSIALRATKISTLIVTSNVLYGATTRTAFDAGEFTYANNYPTTP